MSEFNQKSHNKKVKKSFVQVSIKRERTQGKKGIICEKEE